MSEYAYANTDFPNDVVDEARLRQEVAASGDLPSADYVRSVESVDAGGAPTGSFSVRIGFPAELTAPEKTALDALVAAHSGAPLSKPCFRASSTLVDLEKDLPAGDVFQVVGGVVTTPDFFSASLSALVARIVGSYRAVGTGAELRVVEDGVTVLGAFSVPEAADWAKMQWFTTTPPSAGTHEYTLEAKLNGATSAAIRFVSMSLLEFCV